MSSFLKGVKKLLPRKSSKVTLDCMSTAVRQFLLGWSLHKNPKQGREKMNEEEKKIGEENI